MPVLELLWTEIAEGGMETALVGDLVDNLGKSSTASAKVS
jgi:hypothetical protein